MSSKIKTDHDISHSTTKDSPTAIPAPSIGKCVGKNVQMECNTRNESSMRIRSGNLFLRATPGDSSSRTFIPRPRSSIANLDENKTHRNQSRASSISSTSSIPYLPVKISRGVTLRNHPDVATFPGNKNAPNNISMFDKFKFFNSKEKSGSKTKGGVFSKRTSGNSGFNSAKSEKSDSSYSVRNESKPGSNHEEPEVSIGLASPGTSGPKVAAQNSSKKTSARSSIKGKKFNNSNVAQYSKEDLTTKLESLKSVPINLSDCATPLKETSERSVHRKKLEHKEISSEPTSKVDKPVQQGSVTYRNTSECYTTQKNISENTEFSVAIHKESEKSQPTQKKPKPNLKMVKVESKKTKHIPH
ncbi:uncharacterized protein LOC143256614 [Tachypleus tridentatus]|uniref:uncharacterized protein LOC143256614 n=1 Tax=Tachypleus tridentatus TaxID=6853 RepID=UPI003FD4082F